MPHATLKLLPGVDQNRTLTLNEAAISYSNLVRFVFDKQGIGLVQKLGGWLKYPSNSSASNVGTVCRALWAWEDTNANTYLGVGCEGTSINGNGLSIVFGNTRQIITPKTDTQNFQLPPLFPASLNGVQTTLGSSTVQINATGTNVDDYDSVYIQTPISVGGLILFGTYKCSYLSGDAFFITSTDALGNPKNATATVGSPGGGAVPTFDPVIGDALVTVTLADHGYVVGDTFSVVVPVLSGSIRFFGNYSVIQVLTANTFTIRADNSATTIVPTSAVTTGTSATITFPGTYNFSVGDQIEVAGTTPAGLATGVTLSGVAISGTAGQFTCSASTLSVGQLLAISGAFGGSGSINDYVNPTTYRISATNGTTTFTLVNSITGSALTTTAGTPSGLTYTIGATVTAATSNTVTYTNGTAAGTYNNIGGTIFNTRTLMNLGRARYLFYRTPGPIPTGTGYGAAGYGDGGYGTGVTPTGSTEGSPIDATDWTLDNWGDTLIACPVGGGIYTWQPATGSTVASIIPQAPSVNDGMFVAMPQRQIIAWGTTFTGIQDPLLLRWCDVNDYNSWIATPTNQAGSYRIPRGSTVVACIQGPQQGIIWTDLAVWAMQYVGPPYVYQFNEIGTGCGLIARKAATSMNGVIYWMGQSQFFRLGPNGVEPIRCPIWDVIFQDLDRTNVNKIRAAANSRFSEIAWHYPTTTNGGEVSAYVKYNVALDQWDFGYNVNGISAARTAWINESVLGAPIGAGVLNTQNLLYQHETSPDADGVVMSSEFQTGYFSMSDGEFKVFVDQVWPDMKWGYYGGQQTAHVQLTFLVADYPEGPVRTYGPYSMTNQTQFLTPRFRGRLMSIKMESDPVELNTFWRIGGMRYRFEPDGKF